MHPTYVRFLRSSQQPGPLDQTPEFVFYKASGANSQPVGQTPPLDPLVAQKRGRGATRQDLIVPRPKVSGDTRPTREWSLQTVPPHASGAARLGQHFQALNLGGNHIISGRDPRLHNQVEAGREIPAFSDSVGAARFFGLPEPPASHDAMGAAQFGIRSGKLTYSVQFVSSYTDRC